MGQSHWPDSDRAAQARLRHRCVIDRQTTRLITGQTGRFCGATGQPLDYLAPNLTPHPIAGISPRSVYTDKDALDRLDWPDLTLKSTLRP
jgi:hypothetical protein